MTKRMPKTLASQIARATLEVVNPQNRGITLTAALRRHGFDPSAGTLPDELIDLAAIMAWLLATYAPRE